MNFVTIFSISYESDFDFGEHILCKIFFISFVSSYLFLVHLEPSYVDFHSECINLYPTNIETGYFAHMYSLI